MPQGQPTTLETRAKAVEEIKARLDAGTSTKGIGKKYGVNDSSVYNWLRAADGRPYERKPRPKKTDRTRKTYTNEFKAKVVEDFVQRPKGVFARDIAKQHGVAEGLVTRWLAESRNGILPTAAEPDRSQIVRAEPPPTNGHAKQLSAQLHLSIGGEAPAGSERGLPLELRMYVQRLEAQNKALRKMLQIAMEAI